jgi:TatD DNase family protein
MLWYALQIMTSYIDTHIHLDLMSSPGPLLEEARTCGVTAWIVPGTSREKWPGLMAIAGRHAGVYAAPGIHPQESGRCQKSHLEELRLLMEQPKVIALGEVGLDRQAASPWQVQEEVFIQMVRLALETDKPLLIHARQGTERILEILQKEAAGRVGGIFHAYSGSLETACRIIDMGFVLGVGGVVTFPTARRLPQVVREIPAEALVLETDAPDMTPEPHRGQPNRPAYLELIARRVADLRGWSLEETARLTSANACRILRLPSQIASGSILEGSHREES